MSIYIKVENFVNLIKDDIATKSDKKVSVYTKDLRDKIEIYASFYGNAITSKKAIIDKSDGKVYVEVATASGIITRNLCTIDEVDNFFWGDRIITKRESSPRKQINAKLEQDIDKELDDLWNRREYKV
jgi:hypothetical protein